MPCCFSRLRILRLSDSRPMSRLLVDSTRHVVCWAHAPGAVPDGSTNGVNPAGVVDLPDAAFLAQPTRQVGLTLDALALLLIGFEDPIAALVRVGVDIVFLVVLCSGGHPAGAVPWPRAGGLRAATVSTSFLLVICLHWSGLCALACVLLRGRASMRDATLSLSGSWFTFAGTAASSAQKTISAARGLLIPSAAAIRSAASSAGGI